MCACRRSRVVVSEVRKYSGTLNLMLKALQAKGVEAVPKDGPPMSEMEAWCEWLFGRMQQLTSVCPELCWLRDASVLWKFLATMESRTADLLRKRKEINEYAYWTLTFDADAAGQRGMGGWHGDVPPVVWEVLGVRGQDQDIADLSAPLAVVWLLALPPERGIP